MDRNYFEGWYFKHQTKNNMLALIPGKSSDGAFIQVITNDKSYNIPYQLSEYRENGVLSINGNSFGKEGVSLHIKRDGIDMSGCIRYASHVPLKSDIMGPFRFFPMECRHRVLSMDHELSGSIDFNGETIDFSGGRGYIEGDSGRSFPRRYSWVQCNTFGEPLSVMASAARIPFAGLRFWGTACAIVYRGVEYRLATYRDARVITRTENELEIRQWDLRLLIETEKQQGHELFAPQKGMMNRIIREHPVCRGRFRFWMGGNLLFDQDSSFVSAEFVE